MNKIYLLLKNIISYYLSIKFKLFLIFKQKLGILQLTSRIHKNKKYFYDVKLKKEWLKNYKISNIINLSIKDALLYSNNEFLNNKNINVGLSTGTSGVSTPFISTEKDRLNWFFAVYIRLFPLSYLKPIRIAFFLKYNNSLYTETTNKSIINIKYFDANYDIKDYLESLLNFSPEIIVAPPQTLKQIVNTNLNFPNLKDFISVSEKLDFIDKNIFKNINLKEIYQATEGFLGTSCNYGKIHLNEDILVIEKYTYTYNEKKYFFPVITDFKREAQFVTRLILDDFLEDSPFKCNCKSTFKSIESIDSRLSDLVVSYYQNKFHLIPSNILSQAILSFFDNKNDYNILQIKINAFIITTTYEVLITSKTNIKKEFEKITKININILWRIYNKKNTLFLKKRRIRSLIKKEIIILDKNVNHINSIKLIPESSKILVKNKNFRKLPNCVIIITI